jgi:hypothetical protein
MQVPAILSGGYLFFVTPLECTLTAEYLRVTLKSRLYMKDKPIEVPSMEKCPNPRDKLPPHYPNYIK